MPFQQHRCMTTVKQHHQQRHLHPFYPYIGCALFYIVLVLPSLVASPISPRNLFSYTHWRPHLCEVTEVDTLQLLEPRKSILYNSLSRLKLYAEPGTSANTSYCPSFFAAPTCCPCGLIRRNFLHQYSSQDISDRSTSYRSTVPYPSVSQSNISISTERCITRTIQRQSPTSSSQRGSSYSVYYFPAGLRLIVVTVISTSSVVDIVLYGQSSPKLYSTFIFIPLSSGNKNSHSSSPVYRSTYMDRGHITTFILNSTENHHLLAKHHFLQRIQHSTGTGSKRSSKTKTTTPTKFSILVCQFTLTTFIHQYCPTQTYAKDATRSIRSSTSFSSTPASKTSSSIHPSNSTTALAPVNAPWSCRASTTLPIL